MTELAHGLAGLDESPADVAVFGERVHHGEPTHVRISSCADRGAVRHARDDVRVYLEEAGELLAAVVPRLVHAHSVYHGIAPCEVDVFKDTGLGVGDGVLVRTHLAVGGDDDHLAGLDVSHELGVHRVEGAGFAGEDDGIPFPAHDEGLQTELVTHRDELVVRHAHDGERAEEIQTRLLHPVFHAGSSVIVDERGDYLAVHRGLEDVPAFDEPILYRGGVDDVAVVRDRHPAVSAVKDHGLGVDDVAGTAGGISHVPDRYVGIRQKFQLLIREDLVDEPHILVVRDLSPGDVDRDARALLPSVLEGEEPVVNFARKRLLFGRNDPEDAALLVHAELFAVNQNVFHNIRMRGQLPLVMRFIISR